MKITNQKTQINNSARVCLVNENKILLVSNDGSCWYLPGGHIEPRETLENAAKREIYEETGYQIFLQDIIYVYEFYDKNIDIHKIECVFLATIDKFPVNNNWSDLGVDRSVKMSKWFSLDEIIACNNIYPDFLKEGKWIESQKNNIYQGYSSN